MRTLLKNQRAMKYSLILGEVPAYLRDEDGNILYETYTDSEGNEIFLLDENGNKIPLDSGAREVLYGTPQEFNANISMSGGEAEAQEYGLSVADYEAIALFSAGAYPLSIGSLIWYGSTPKCKYESETSFEIEGEDGNKITVRTTAPEETSADYRVIKISTSLSFTRIILKAIVK